MLWDSVKSWKAFSAFCWCLWKHFPSKKVLKMLEEVVVGWWEVRWICRMRQNFAAQFIRLLKPWLCHVWLGVMVEKNWAHFVDQCWLQVFQFSGHLIDLLSIILRCNTFAWIQKTIVDQTGSRPPNSDHDLFLVQVWLWKVHWSFFSVQPLSLLFPVVIYDPLSLHITIQSRNGSIVVVYKKRWHFKITGFFFFKFSVSSWGTHLSSFFTFPICLKCWMTVEESKLSSSVYSCVVVRGSAPAPMNALNRSLSTFNHRPLCSSSSSRLSSPFGKILEPLLHRMFVSSSWAKCTVDIVSCLCCFMTHFELE